MYARLRFGGPDREKGLVADPVKYLVTDLFLLVSRFPYFLHWQGVQENFDKIRTWKISWVALES